MRAEPNAPAAEVVRQSSAERLRKLPALFRGADLTLRFRWTSKTASQYLYLWKQRGWVQALGGHSDVYANTLMHADRIDWEKALLKAMPTGIIVGLESLRRANWITQIPARPQVAVRRDMPHYQVDRFEIAPVPRLEHADLLRHTREELCQSMPVLDPAYALVEMVHQKGWGRCGLDPDDVYVEEMTANDLANIVRACENLEIGLDAFDEILAGSDVAPQDPSRDRASDSLSVR